MGSGADDSDGADSYRAWEEHFIADLAAHPQGTTLEQLSDGLPAGWPRHGWTRRWPEESSDVKATAFPSRRLLRRGPRTASKSVCRLIRGRVTGTDRAAQATAAIRVRSSIGGRRARARPVTSGDSRWFILSDGQSVRAPAAGRQLSGGWAGIVPRRTSCRPSWLRRRKRSWAPPSWRSRAWAFNRPVADVTDSGPLAAGRAPAAALPTVIQPKPSERPGEAACQAGVPAPDGAGVPARQ